MKEAQDREGLMGEALRRAVRGRQRGPGVLVFPELVQRTGIGARHASLLT
jgi:hypothetical protein